MTIPRIDAEIATIEAAIRAGDEPLDMLVLGGDWCAERDAVIAELTHKEFVIARGQG